jgi:YgiT-type zinc finger domain-containing protein
MTLEHSVRYPCRNCSFGTLKPIKLTYVRQWGNRMITMPNFAAWRCDSCNYTRYDAAALAKIELLLGPDVEALFSSPTYHSQHTEGPGERGPRRWSS